MTCFWVKMEINIIEDEKDKLKFEIKGETHTFCNILRKKLWENKHVKVAGYNIKHALTSAPIFTVETDNEEKPRQALKKAVSSLQKDFSDFKIKFKNALK